MEQYKALLIHYGQFILLGLVVLFIGLRIAKVLMNLFNKAMDKKEVDPSLKPFLSSVLSWVLKIAVILTAINTAGIKTTSFLALLGTAGLAVGLALQGSLSNFAGGVLILLLKPFKVGDVIKAQGHVGTVDKITTFSTFLKTADNQIIYLPNGSLANTSIVNINHEKTRRVDFTVGIGYEDDIDLAKDILKGICAEDERILEDPAYVVQVSSLGDSSVNLTVKAWTLTENYWAVLFSLNEIVKKSFDENKVSIPFPQRDVHLHQ